MRSWLNGYGSSVNVCEKDYTANNFMDNAFTSGEQAAIRTTAAVTESPAPVATPSVGSTTSEGSGDSANKVSTPDHKGKALAKIS